MKTAKEMFEDLGYKVTANNKYFLEYEKEEETIGFFKNDKTFFKQNYIEAGDITMQELKAINKMVKELNWNE